MYDFLTDDEIEIGELDNLHEKIKGLKSDCLQIIKDVKNTGIVKYKSGKYSCSFCSMSKRWNSPFLIEHAEDCLYLKAEMLLHKISK